jgi:hypothetical protein
MSRKYRPGERWKLVDGEVLTVLRVGVSNGIYICTLSGSDIELWMTARDITRLVKSATKL